MALGFHFFSDAEFDAWTCRTESPMLPLDLFSNIRVFSFDVFDTVLTRRTAEPKGIFAAVQAELMRDDSEVPSRLRRDYVRQRISAERYARIISKTEDTTLKEIYRVIQRQYRLSEHVAERLMELEIRQELNAAWGLPHVLLAISKIRNLGGRVIFMSDMYLPGDIIKQVLIKVGAYEEGDGLYVSNESGLTKASGNLYRYMLTAEKCTADQVAHIGDSFKSDVIVPRRMGIRAVHYRASRLNRFESALLKSWKGNGAPENRSQLLVGASRMARLNSRFECTDHHRTIYELGVSLAGPILFGYVTWVLKQAVARDIKKLYFLARDGQILLELGRKILPRTGADIDLRYLYGSRQAWNLPAMTSIGSRELEWITSVNPVLTLKKVAARLDLSFTILRPLLVKAGIHHSSPDQRLSDEEVQHLRNVLQRNPEVAKTILDHAKDARSVALDYFRQEGLCDDKPFGLVDTGWYGRMQDSLRSMLLEAGCRKRIVGFYFGLRGEREQNCKEAFFFNPQSPLVYQTWGKAFISILEVLTAADHGMTVSYRRLNNGRVVPKLREPENQTALQWGLRTLREGIHAFVDSASKDSAVIEPDHYAFREGILRLIKKLVSRPSVQEASILGSYLFSSEQTESTLECLAPPLSVKDIGRAVLDPSGRLRKSITLWPEASVMRSDALVRAVIPLFSIRPCMSGLDQITKFVGSLRKGRITS